MKQFFIQLFTWWNGATLGTRFNTWRFGSKVGEDEAGNVYFQGGKDLDGRPRRWVHYNGPAEASRIPPGWHGWMHHRTDIPPVRQDYAAWSWEKPHQENMTGTAHAYRPKGSILSHEERPRVTGDYDAWTPKS